MSKKKVIGGIVAVCLVVFSVVYVKSYIEVNSKWKDAPVEVYEKNEKVAMEDDILQNYTMKGYAIAVTDAEVMEYEDYLKKYGGKDEYTIVPDKVYDVTITLWNDGAEDGVGIDFNEFYIQGTATISSINDQLLDLANPAFKGSTAVALRPNTEMEMHLPFNLYEDFFRKNVWENLDTFDMYLVATLYPTKKMIKLV